MIYFYMFQIRFTRVPHDKWTEEGDSKTIFLVITGLCLINE